MVIVGLGLRISGIVKILQSTSSEKPIFIYIDTLDESRAEH